MSISQWTATVGAAAAITLLAGCSGVSQYAPSTAGGGQNSVTMSAGRGVGHPTIVGPFASQRLNDAFYHRPIVAAQRVDPARKKAGCKKAKKKGLVFGSDNSSGILYAYCGHNGGDLNANQEPYKSVTDGAGWGLAVHGNLLAAGLTGGSIGVYKLPSLTRVSTLTLAHAGSGYNAYGLAFDSNGGLYATEWPGPYLDYFEYLGNGTATCSHALTLMSEAYFVTAHAGTVDVYGFNGFSSQIPVVLENDSNANCFGTFTESLVGTFGNLAAGTGFPGGTTVNNTGEVFVNNQYGTLYDDGGYPGSGTPTGSCSWGFDPNDLTNINMSTQQNSIWGSNIFIYYGSYLESFSTTISAGTCAVGSSGGPTGLTVQDEFLGVTAWPNTGDN